MESVVETYDVAICGAGPAGSTCALALQKSGLKVVLIDKNSFPRNKVCGDAIGAYVPKVLNTIDPKYAEAFQKIADKEPIRLLRIVAPNKKTLDIKYPAEGYTCARINFDLFLFDLASKLPNVTVRCNTTLKDITINNDGITLKTDSTLIIEAKLVIGCDGAHSIISKKLTDTKMDLNHHAGAVRAYYKNVTGIPQSTIEFHFSKDILPGYLWIFPMKDNISNVGLGVLSSSVSQKKINLRACFTKMLNAPNIKERFKDAEMISELEGYGLPFGSRKVTVSGNRFMLCGDAASLIDPVSGEGIGQAIVSGRYAGWHAIKCFEKNNFSDLFMKGYEKTLYDKLWKENRRRYMIQRLINGRPWLINSAVSLANKSNTLLNLFKKI